MNKQVGLKQKNDIISQYFVLILSTCLVKGSPESSDCDLGGIILEKKKHTKWLILDILQIGI